MSRSSLGVSSRTPLAGSARPRLYLAGPFTEMTVPAAAADEDVASTNGALEVIPAGAPWRSALEKAEAELRRAGWDVFLPHRDVSHWGARHVPPGRIAAECLEAVCSCHAVLALAGQSFGTHVEVGAALGRGIPVLIVRAADQQTSFFAQALSDSDLVVEFVISAATALPQLVASPPFRQALSRAYPHVADLTG